MSDRSVFAALAAPRRRDILELLRDRGPLRAGDIAARFKGDSQPGISRHLKILRETGLVETAVRGRENFYALNAAPLVRERDGWLATFERSHVDRLSALRDSVERRDRGPGDKN